MRYIFQYPDVHGLDGDMLDAGPVADLAATAERSGWAGFAFTEHPAPSPAGWRAEGIRPLTRSWRSAHVAAVTDRLKLLTYLAVAAVPQPALLAKSAATVDMMSNGRFILGVGTGYLKSEFYALGVDFDERNELFDEALDVLPLHWTGEPFSYEGKHFNAAASLAGPRPRAAPIPIWIGGNAKITLRRVADACTGLDAAHRAGRAVRHDALATGHVDLRHRRSPRHAPRSRRRSHRRDRRTASPMPTRRSTRWATSSGTATRSACWAKWVRRGSRSPDRAAPRPCGTRVHRSVRPRCHRCPIMTTAGGAGARPATVDCRRLDREPRRVAPAEHQRCLGHQCDAPPHGRRDQRRQLGGDSSMMSP